jgi:hypothetical protein
VENESGNLQVVQPQENAIVRVGGKKVTEVTVPAGTPFEHIFSLIQQAGYTEARVRTFDPVTKVPIEIAVSNAPRVFEPGRTYEISPYDKPGI